MALLTVCSSSTYETLASLDSLKGILGIDLTSTGSDDLLSKVLVRATQSIEDFLGRPLRKQTYYEKVRSYGSMFVHVTHTPIQSVSRILLNDILVNPTEYELGSPKEGSIYRKYGWQWTAGSVTDLVPHVVPGTERYDLAVEYVGGWVPSSSTSTMLAVPGTIEQATIETAKAWWLGRKTNPNVKFKKVGDLEIEYISEGEDIGKIGIPTVAEALLQSYARVV